MVKALTHGLLWVCGGLMGAIEGMKAVHALQVAAHSWAGAISAALDLGR